jgi:hypothetical protein
VFVAPLAEALDGVELVPAGGQLDLLGRRTLNRLRRVNPGDLDLLGQSPHVALPAAATVAQG